MKLDFGNFMKIVSQSYCAFVVRTQTRLQYSFLTQIFLQLIILEKEDMKQNLENIVKKV